jgi:hypothetical protein
MRFFRARIALARGAEGESRYLRVAASDATHLEREDVPWARALGRLIRASICATSGRKSEARSQLESAERALLDTDMKHYAAAAQYRRGQLLDNDEGRVALAAASQFFEELGVVRVDRILGLLAPGRW